MNVYELNRTDFLAVMNEYDRYIQCANKENKYETGWRPVSVNEFYNNEYQEILSERDEPDKIIITLEGGIVQSVLSSDKNVDVIVIDRDSDGADEEEYYSEDEVKDFIDDKVLNDIGFVAGVYEDDFNDIATIKSNY